MRRLAIRDARELLKQLGPVAEKVVLVGGQAVNFWAEYYGDRAPALAENAPYTSKDIDFAGGPQDVEAIAARVRGRAWLTPPFDPSPNAGVVSFPGPSGEEQQIDILRVVHGLNLTEVDALARPIEETSDGTTVRFRVMHPVHCLESRASNVAELPDYNTPQAVNQLRASVICAREFLREILAAGATRATLDLNERIYKFRRYNSAAAVVLRDHQVDVFEAVINEEGLPEEFRAIRYPQMRADLGLAP